MPQVSQAEINWYKEILPEPATVFDVGCRNDNVFYDLNNELEIHLFDPKTPGVLLHGTFNQVALSNTTGLHDYYLEYSSMHERDLKGEKWEHITHQKIRVPTMTIDQYCNMFSIQSIDLLKIDTEGHDYYVLEGGMKMLPNIKYIQFEHWNNYMTDKTIELLKDFQVEILGGKPTNYKAKRK